jgi:hypothetical protein
MTMINSFNIGDTCFTQAGFHFVIADFQDWDGVVMAQDTDGYLCPISRLRLYRAA